MSPRIRRLQAALSQLTPFWWWLFWFYCAWVTLILVGSYWDETVAHWPIAVAMAAGSYIAGSTPMGGGTIGFPVLVIFFDGPASLGRGFSFCIQSIGMSSAAVFLLASRAPIAFRILLWAMLGSVVTIPVTVTWLAPLVADLTVKLTFASLWAAFGVMTLVKIRDFVRAHHAVRGTARMDMAMGLAVGVIGGVSTGITGVGLDMVLYCVLVLIYRADLRAAIGTSVIVMAFGSLIGTVTGAALGRLDEAVFHNWLAAAPVVALGAPLGVLVMRIIPRDYTLVVVSVLCIGQLVYTCWDERVPLFLIGVVVLAVLGVNLGFHYLYRWGKRLVPEHAGPPAE